MILFFILVLLIKKMDYNEAKFFINSRNNLLLLDNFTQSLKGKVYSTINEIVSGSFHIAKIIYCTSYFIIKQFINEIMEKSSVVEKFLIVLFIYEFLRNTYKFYKLEQRNRLLRRDLESIQNVVKAHVN